MMISFQPKKIETKMLILLNTQWRISTVCAQIKNELSLGDKKDLHWKNLTICPHKQPEKPKHYKPILIIPT
jgi:hypothetical protein